MYEGMVSTVSVTVSRELVTDLLTVGYSSGGIIECIDGLPKDAYLIDVALDKYGIITLAFEVPLGSVEDTEEIMPVYRKVIKL